MEPLPSLTTVAIDAAEPARLARACQAVDQACALARWVGEAGRPVTASRVLRRADVAAARAALAVAVPPRVRTSADVPVLRRPWSSRSGRD